MDRARRALGLRRVGHTGTLDPFATGVLPLCLGRATRLAAYLSSGVKAYDATLRLGFATSTDDLTGEPLGEPQGVSLRRDEVETACRRFVGEIEQLPPAYSAKKIGGQRLYALARRGEAVERRPARVTVRDLVVVRVAGDEVELRVRCSAGTYIRALARDLGAALGPGAHLTALRRTESAGLGLSESVGWDQLTLENAAGLRSKILPLNKLLPDWPFVVVTEDGARAVRHGRSLAPEQVIEPAEPGSQSRVRILDADGALLAIGERREGRLHPHLVLVD